MDGGIATEVFPDPCPARPRDPQIDHTGCFQVGDFPAPGEQGWLIAIA
jgi:hypothetical protein